MKKTLLLSGMIVLALTLVGCGQKNQTASPDQTQNPIETKKDDSLAGQVINSAETLKNAITGGKKLECTYKMKSGTDMGEIKSYIDGKKYKSTFELNGEKHISIMDGEVMYSWSEKTKKGSKMDISCMKELSKNLPKSNDQGQTNYESSDQLADNMMDISCQPSSLVDFSIPSDVTFTDTCEQMKKTMEQLQNIKGLPTGQGLPY